MRLDQYLVTKKLCRSRSQAKELIALGLVRVDGKVITKASYEIGPEAKLSIDSNPLQNYVARSALKLLGALEHFAIDVRHLDCLDIGVSTGGFSQVLLERGAATVVGIEVGHGQTASQLLEDPRFQLWEHTNARVLHELTDLRDILRKCRLVVMDVSFISIEKIFPALAASLSPGAHLLSLVKPQFELSRHELNKQGIVSEPRHYDLVREKIYASLKQNNFEPIDYIASEWVGADGNQEFFVYAKFPLL